MTKSEIEIAAYNEGAEAVLRLAHVTGLAMHTKTIERPTRYNFAAEALMALAEEGRTLLKGGNAGQEAPSQPVSPIDRPGGAAAALVVPAQEGDDGNFGLTDEEIMRPSREIIIGWLKGRYPMLASHWSRIAARMLAEAETVEVVAAAE